MTSQGETGDMPPVEIPIDGMLDLHTFSPGETGSLVPEYLEECRRKGIMEVRIVHGKGLGVLRKSVHAILERLDIVESYRPAPHDRGHWGATMVKLKVNASGRRGAR